jgi:hypothetical protein
LGKQTGNNVGRETVEQEKKTNRETGGKRRLRIRRKGT